MCMLNHDNRHWKTVCQLKIWGTILYLQAALYRNGQFTWAKYEKTQRTNSFPPKSRIVIFFIKITCCLYLIFLKANYFLISVILWHYSPLVLVKISQSVEKNLSYYKSPASTFFSQKQSSHKRKLKRNFTNMKPTIEMKTTW